MKNYPRNIIIHHTAVSYNKNPNQFDAVNRYHKDKGWGMIGYHYLIEKDGTVKKGREENQAGAHCYQSLMNYRSLGICLTGNFDIEDPTKEQKEALYALVLSLKTKYRIPDERVVPHRKYANYKSCWGSRMPENIMEYLLDGEIIPDWRDTFSGLSAESIWKEAKLKQIVSQTSQFQDPVSKGELMIFFKRVGLL